MHSEPDLAAADPLLAEPARAELVLAALADGPLSASELAARAGVSRSTASGHLRRLVEGRFLVVAAQGRNRRYELAGPEVAEAVEALSRVAPPRPARSLREANRNELIREARTCYDHLAGVAGVDLLEAMRARGWVRAADRGGPGFELTARGERELARRAVDVTAARASRRRFATACLDWTERRPHLGGALGAGVLDALCRRSYVRRRPRGRDVQIARPLAGWLGR